MAKSDFPKTYTDLSSKLDFGENSGQTVQEVIDGDFDYIEWACNNYVIILKDDAKKYYNQKASLKI